MMKQFQVSDKVFIDANGDIQSRHPREPIHDPLQVRVAKWIGGVVLVATLGLVLGVVLVEFMSGCGEVTHYSDRTWVSNDCVFQDTQIQRGKW